MLIVLLIVLGLCVGSFVNAWVWRVHQQAAARSAKTRQKYSVLHGRSMCVHCKHTLSAADLVPLFSWLLLKGKCRYCKKPIAAQYPLVELLAAVLFVFSYLFWPLVWSAESKVLFGFWLVELICLLALAVYDLRWYLLPNKMLVALGSVFGVQLVMQVVLFGVTTREVGGLILAALVGGGFFWLIFQVSQGKWIGGGDVKLGAVLGLLVGSPAQAFLVLFFASVLGSLLAIPLLLGRRLGAKSQLPFGPFLIVATVVVRSFGAGILAWYMRLAGF